MALATPVLANFTGGEVSPKVYGRTDLSRYYNSVAICENMIVVPQGMLDRRGGTRFVAPAKYDDKLFWLVEFEFNDLQAYVVEKGDFYARFFKDKGQIVAPATDAAVTNGGFAGSLAGWTESSVTYSSGGALFAAGGQIYQQIAGSAGVLHVLRFKVAGVVGRDKLKLKVGTTLHGAEVLAEKEFEPGWHCVSFTPAGASFYIEWNLGYGTPTLDDVKFLDDEPVELVTGYGEQDVDSLAWAQSADVLFLVHAMHWTQKLVRSAHTSWSLVYLDFVDGPYLDENITETTLTPAATTGDAIAVTASAAAGINGGEGFKATDLGRAIHIEHGATKGWGRIVEVTSATAVKVHVRKAFGGTGAVKTWRLGLYSDTTGWPIADDFHEQRLCFAGASVRPARVDGSATGDFETFTPGTEDADAFAYNQGVNKIYWLASTSVLVGGTPGGAFVMRTDAAGSPITPTNVQAKRNGRAGSAFVRPLKLDSVIYAQRHGRKVLSYDYNLEKDAFLPVDLTLFADHVTESGLIHSAYQAEPFGLLWYIRADGMPIACTFLPEQEVIGWHRHPLGGKGRAEAMAGIPGDASDEIWFGTVRTINGQQRRYIEVLEQPLPDTGRQDEAFYVDCGLSLSNSQAVTLTPAATTGAAVVFEAGGALFDADDVGREIHHDYVQETTNAVGLVLTKKVKARALITAFNDPTHVTAEILGAVPFPSTGAIAAGDWRLTVTTILNLEHLEGCMVQVLADGAVQPDRQVTGGSIALDTPASKIHVGLQYPAKVKILPLVAGQREGSATTKPQRISKLTLQFLRSVGGLAGRDEATLQAIQTRTALDPMNEPEPLITGYKEIDFPGDWDRGVTALVVQHLPLPMTLNSIVPTVETIG